MNNGFYFSEEFGFNPDINKKPKTDKTSNAKKKGNKSNGKKDSKDNSKK